MGFNCGIVGLPNVGKSTLFNALTQTASAQAANYPFCTIEPNIGCVAVPDPRLQILSNLAKSKEIIPTQLEFVDIAGLVKGAHKGEGLGNQFLSHIRQVDAIIHVLRCFEDDDITHVEGSVDPIRDIEIIETELLLADLENVEKRLSGLEKKSRSGDKDAKAQEEILSVVLEDLKKGTPAREIKIEDAEKKKIFDLFQLLTAKPLLYVCNVEEENAATGNAFSEQVSQKGKAVIISAAIEQEIAQLSDAREREEFLETLGLKETGLSQIIRAGYDLLNLITFFTAGPKETRAWTIKEKTKAPQAAGVIHTDFEKGFIRAEVMGYDDYVASGGEQGAKENGKMRTEGKEYVLSDGDICHFLFHV